MRIAALPTGAWCSAKCCISARSTTSRLQDGELIAISGGLIGGGERVGQPGEPPAYHHLDTEFIELIEELLQALRILTVADAVIECLESQAGLLQLPFGVLVAVETDARGIGK